MMQFQLLHSIFENIVSNQGIANHMGGNWKVLFDNLCMAAFLPSFNSSWHDVEDYFYWIAARLRARQITSCEATESMLAFIHAKRHNSTETMLQL